MITIQLSLRNQTLGNAIAGASKHGLSLEDYIDMKLNADGFIQESAPAPAPGSDGGGIEQLAKTLFEAAIDYPEGGQLFLIEDVYKQLDLSPWEEQGVGARIRLGKAFMRLVKLQLEGGTLRDDNIQVRIDAEGKTAQNQQLYRLNRVG
jgi:hypothetical protein